jgi:hypothetical protein
MASRLAKSSFNLAKRLTDLRMPPLDRGMTKIDVWTLPNMTTAAAAVSKRLIYWPLRDEKKSFVMAAHAAASNGNAARLSSALEDSDSLIADAISADQRLARRSQWTRGEEGEVVCPALLSQGDDAPCFYRARALLSQPNGSEPVKVVISTDGSDIRPRTAAAFIATCRLVQQYRPLEIYWQGSWLSEGRQRGWVFHVPLVQGDMDFARLEFCIADPHRDSLSWMVMMVRAIEDSRSLWNGCSLQAEYSYMPGAQFVSHHGIYPDGQSVASHAADWLGWDSLYRLKWAEEDAIKAALQELPTARVAPRARTEAERKEDDKRWREYDERRKKQEQQEAQARAEKVGCLTTT